MLRITFYKRWHYTLMALRIGCKGSLTKQQLLQSEKDRCTWWVTTKIIEIKENKVVSLSTLMLETERGISFLSLQLWKYLKSVGGFNGNCFWKYLVEYESRMCNTGWLRGFIKMSVSVRSKQQSICKSWCRLEICCERKEFVLCFVFIMSSCAAVTRISWMFVHKKDISPGSAFAQTWEFKKFKD